MRRLATALFALTLVLAACSDDDESSDSDDTASTEEVETGEDGGEDSSLADSSTPGEFSSTAETACELLSIQPPELFEDLFFTDLVSAAGGEFVNAANDESAADPRDAIARRELASMVVHTALIIEGDGPVSTDLDTLLREYESHLSGLRDYADAIEAGEDAGLPVGGPPDAAFAAAAIADYATSCS